MDSTYRAGATENSLPQQKSAGTLLREARKLKGFSQEKVASHLNLMPSHILALESDAYNPDLEGRHFVDYLTAFAELVDLNPRAVRDLYRDNEGTFGLNPEPYQPLVTRRQTYQDLNFSQQDTAALSTAGMPGGINLPVSNALAYRVATVLSLVCVAWLITSRGIGPEELMASLPGFNGGSEVVSGGVGGSEVGAAAVTDVGLVASAVKLDANPVEDSSSWSTPDWANGDAISKGSSNKAIRKADTAKAEAVASSTERELLEKMSRQQSAPKKEVLASASASVDALHASTSIYGAESGTVSSKRADSSALEATARDKAASKLDQSYSAAAVAGTAATTEPGFAAQSADSSLAGVALTNVVSSTGEDVMVFSFFDSCWIEVYDNEQNPLVMDTKMPGEALRISGKAPFEVRVGNSRAVALTLNGRPVAIDRHPTIESTELIVGSRAQL